MLTGFGFPRGRFFFPLKNPDPSPAPTLEAAARRVSRALRTQAAGLSCVPTLRPRRGALRSGARRGVLPHGRPEACRLAQRTATQIRKGDLGRVTLRPGISKGDRCGWSRDTYIVQLVVEPAGVAHRVPVGIPSPESGSGGLTVCTGRSCPSCCRLGRGGEGRGGDQNKC